MQNIESKINLTVIWRGNKYTVEMNSNASLKDLGDELQKLTAVKQDTLRLIVPQFSNKSSKLLSPFSDEHSRLSLLEASITERKSIRMMGVSEDEIDKVLQNAKVDLRIAGFDEEEKRMRQRTPNGRHALIKLPPGPYTFCDFRTLQLPGIELNPPASEALKRMHMLAADPGIVAIMNKHHWRVGIMTEMAPVGYVGVSPKCILGFNKNHGEEISLRLRTDDLKGFRKYESIKKTLLHELAHMVYSEHDANFYALDKQLNEEAASLDWTKSRAHTFGGIRHPNHDEEEFYVAENKGFSQKLGGTASDQLASACASSVAAAYRRSANAAASYSAVAEVHEEPDPDDSDMHHEPDPDDSVTHHEPDPDDSDMHYEPDPDDSVTHHEPDPNDSVTHHEPDPNDSVNHHEPNPDDSDRHCEPDPDDSVTHNEPDPDDSLMHHEPDPDDLVTHHEPDPDDSVNHHEPDPDDSVTHHEPDPDESVSLKSSHKVELSADNEPDPDEHSCCLNNCEPNTDDSQGSQYQVMEMNGGIQPSKIIAEPDPDDTEAKRKNSGHKNIGRHYQNDSLVTKWVEELAHLSKSYKEPDPDDSQANGIMQTQPDADECQANGVMQAEPDPDDALPPHEISSMQIDEPDPDDEELRRIQDPVTILCGRLQKVIKMLRAEVSPTEATTALQTLFKIIRNVIEHPDELKYKRLRKANPVVKKNIANHKAAMEILWMVGFGEDVVYDEIGKAETYLVLKRNDPGLLWLAKSSLEECVSY